MYAASDRRRAVTSVRLPFGPKRVDALIGGVALAAAGALALTAPSTVDAISARPQAFASLFVLTLALGLVAVEIYGRGSISVAGVGVLTVGLTLGAGPAMVTGVALAAVHLVRMRSVSRSIFNAGTLALAAASAVLVYDALVGTNLDVLDRLLPSIAAGVAYWAVNIGLLTLVMSLSEAARFWTIWRERFRWLTFHYIAFGPLAMASTVAYEKVGVPVSPPSSCRPRSSWCRCASTSPGLHDIGKIGIPERILNKPSSLDAEEWIVMKRHPVVSEYILSGVEVSPLVREIARSSHERMDGTGYPDGLLGDDIPLAARVVFVADAFDALTSDRPYRLARDVESALEEIRRNAASAVLSACRRGVEHRGARGAPRARRARGPRTSGRVARSSALNPRLIASEQRVSEPGL